MDLRDDISSLKGIGEKSAALFHKVGVFSLSDLIRYFPSSYIRYPGIKKVCDIRPDEKAALSLKVLTEAKIAHVKGMSMLTFMAGDDTGSLRITYFNMPYLKKAIKVDMERIFYGTVKVRGQSYGLSQPKMYKADEYERLTDTLTPVYPLTKGLTEKTVIKAVSQAFAGISAIEDEIPDQDRKRLGLEKLRDSLFAMHFPDDRGQYIKARERVVFDEFRRFLVSMRKLKSENRRSVNDFPVIEVSEAKRLTESLPYRLTKAQQQAYEDIISDMGSDRAMNRLIEGDVGSGKTIVALLAMLTVVKNGHQAALMAPTEVLAAQHMKKISALMESYDVKCVLLTGALTEKQKKEAREEIADGTADIIIGTHALITDLVEYKDLALAVCDEQHRFGVRQRENLSDRLDGKNPHVLVISATPIPRTLAIILYGDLDISVMNERPAKRLEIKNAVVDTDYRQKAYNFIRKEVKNGGQAYVICPPVEPSESGRGENVLEYTERLREIWGDGISVGTLHGRMKNSEKNSVMNRFAAGDISVLVSTTVVEVGVDVPNATVMMIENAENFGLSQLHQLRGRIGRGDKQSYCIFVDTSGEKEASKRLEVLKKTNDGFEIASEDLKLRGPGDIFGIRQSGELGFKVGDIYTDAAILKKASDYVNEKEGREPSADIGKVVL